MPGRRNHMPGPIASLALVSHDGATATFHVHDADKKDRDEFYKWVACIGYDADDVQTSAAYSPVVWDTSGVDPLDDGTATVTLGAAPGNPPPVRYEAFVVLWPDVWTPRSDTVGFAA